MPGDVNVDAAAAALGLQRETVWTCLRSIVAKTGVDRRSAFVHLLPTSRLSGGAGTTAGLYEAMEA